MVSSVYCEYETLLSLNTGDVDIDVGHNAELETLMREAKLIVASGWKPAFVMIDKSLANKLAINRGTDLW